MGDFGMATDLVILCSAILAVSLVIPAENYADPAELIPEEESFVERSDCHQPKCCSINVNAGAGVPICGDVIGINGCKAGHCPTDFKKSKCCDKKKSPLLKKSKVKSKEMDEKFKVAATGTDSTNQINNYNHAAQPSGADQLAPTALLL